jgi:succinate dehydrogenase flavin-adding protein (antitoxin of CptAB toxin-antitoxin module)
MDFGDFIEECDLPIYILNRYFCCTSDTIEEEHLKKLARALFMSPDDLYDMLSENKPLRSRFG